MLRASVIRFGLVCFGLLGLGCGAGSEAREPTPSLSETRAAQSAYRSLAKRWFEYEEAERPQLRPSLRGFLTRFPADPRAASVRLLLAWLSILEHDLPTAERLIAEARSSSAPSVRDFAEVTAARLLLSRGNPEAALATLLRLQGKLVDPAERVLSAELRLQAALSSRRFEDALAALADYLSEAPAELGDRARARGLAALSAMPEAALERSLLALDDKARRGPLSPPDVWLRRVVRERLIRLAVEQKDAALARRLLDTHPGLARRNDLSAELLQLAASASTAEGAHGAFVGLVLEVGDADAERRSASIARGLSDALSASLPGADSLPVVVRATAAERVGEALTELSQAGALALVAGVTDTSSERAAKWALTGKAPVLLIRDTPNLIISELSFVLGTSDLDQLDAIQKELTRRHLGRWVRVGSGGFDCRASVEKAGQARFPVKDWKQEGVEAVAVLGPRPCALSVFADLRSERFGPLVAVGLEGADALPSFSGRRFALSAGSFPSAEAVVPPDFYESLGHDAGTLLRRAWGELDGGARASDEERARLPSILGAISVALQTTEATGFVGKRRLQRHLVIREAS